MPSRQVLVKTLGFKATCRAIHALPPPARPGTVSASYVNWPLGPFHRNGSIQTACQPWAGKEVDDLQGEREQMRGKAQEAEGIVGEWQGRTTRFVGSARKGLGRAMSDMRGDPTTGLIRGSVAFLLAAGLLTLVLFPTARWRAQWKLGRYTGRARAERPIDRLGRWSHDVVEALGFRRYWPS